MCNLKFFNFLSLIFDSVFRFHFRIPESGFNVLVLPCLIIRRKQQENMVNLTFCRQDVEHSPFAVGNTRRNATLRNVSQSIFLRKEIALLRKVVGESACYTSIYVFDTKRRTTRFKVRKALNNKFVCVFITCKVYRNWMLIKFTTGIIVRQENRS